MRKEVQGFCHFDEIFAASLLLFGRPSDVVFALEGDWAIRITPSYLFIYSLNCSLAFICESDPDQPSELASSV